eukprot:CAMPEP_0170179884 /NCGR_PEP_ID=MMETSP0040_2-20121228/19680_1 /TAXON_ID=641309 /ORGANISM="Lotharella oceanica, Strain CCMP622" /LENGTH=266 /DNA_ID=CAMNT_0010424251 /DNA_START=73 /DNA_END=873 /DNA_ORIENTATION=+
MTGSGRHALPPPAAATAASISRRGMASASAAGAGAGVSIDGDQNIVIKGSDADTATVVFMHGLGDTGHGWVDGVMVLSKYNPHVKFILPSADTQPVTLNFGAMMPSWYDIQGLDLKSNEKCQGIDSSMARIVAIIENELKSRPCSRIMLGGFSQGGAMSLYCGLKYPQPLAGLICMSGYLPKPDSVSGLQAKMKEIPIRLFHGEADEVVRYEFAEKTLGYLKEKGMKDVNLLAYRSLVHSASMEELKDVSDFIQEVLPDEKPKPKL